MHRARAAQEDPAARAGGRQRARGQRRLARPARYCCAPLPLLYCQSLLLTTPHAAGMVEDVQPRKSELLDPAVANVDNVLVVFSVVDPPWDGQMATRFLVCAERAQIPVCIVLNKADLATPQQAADAVAEVGAQLSMLHGSSCVAC